MISAGLASRTRVRCAWNKFKELASIVTARGASLKLKGNIYTGCVQSVMVYDSEALPVKVQDIQSQKVDLDQMPRVRIRRWLCDHSALIENLYSGIYGAVRKVCHANFTHN